MQVFREDGSFFCNVMILEKFSSIGLMFKRGLPENFGLLLKMNSEYIHSFFVFFKFHAIFLDSNFRVVDECIMRPFKIKKAKAKWVLELMPGKEIRKGERLFIGCPPHIC